MTTSEQKYASELQTLCDIIMGTTNTPAPFRVVERKAREIMAETPSESPGSTRSTKDRIFEYFDASVTEGEMHQEDVDYFKGLVTAALEDVEFDLELRCRSLEAALKEAGNWLSGIAEDLDGSGCEIEAKQMRKSIEDLIKPLAQGSGGGSNG